jgi:hypothetical protein
MGRSPGVGRCHGGDSSASGPLCLHYLTTSSLNSSMLCGCAYSCVFVKQEVTNVASLVSQGQLTVKQATLSASLSILMEMLGC